PQLSSVDRVEGNEEESAVDVCQLRRGQADPEGCVAAGVDVLDEGRAADRAVPLPQFSPVYAVVAGEKKAPVADGRAALILGEIEGTEGVRVDVLEQRRRWDATLFQLFDATDSGGAPRRLRAARFAWWQTEPIPEPIRPGCVGHDAISFRAS